MSSLESNLTGQTEQRAGAKRSLIVMEKISTKIVIEQGKNQALFVKVYYDSLLRTVRFLRYPKLFDHWTKLTFSGSLSSAKTTSNHVEFGGQYLRHKVVVSQSPVNNSLFQSIHDAVNSCGGRTHADGLYQRMLLYIVP